MVAGFQEEERTLKCMHCQGRMERGTAPLTVDRKGYHVHWDAVPAWICTQCGEPYFEAHEVEGIQKALALLDQECATLAKDY